jgi:DNA repair exonuclease SbcCD ATPase subunit
LILIAIGPQGPLAVFLQVLSWIIIPALLLVWLLTILHHYARKRKHAANALQGDDLAQLALAGKSGDGAYLLFDHTGLIRDYKNKLSYSHARYNALKKDFEKLEKQYKQASVVKGRPFHPKTKQMETIHDQEAVTTGAVNSEELFLKDLVEEKKAEVAFLQAQLEQRVRRQHETEAEKERLRAELQAQLTEKDQLIKGKEDQIAYTGTQLAALKEQNELLNAAVADGNDRTQSLQMQLEEEQSRVTAMEQKLQANKQLLQRLYKEFAACVEEDNASPAVITMQPYRGHLAADY